MRSRGVARGVPAAVLAALGVAAACGPPRQPRPGPETSAEARAPVTRRPRLQPQAVGTIVILDIALPPAGSRIGTHLEGLARPARAADLRMSDGLRVRWARRSRLAGDSVLREAGFLVRPLGPPTSDAEPLGRVRFGLSAEVTDLVVNTTGRVAPVQVDARVEAVWALVDLAAGGVTLEMRTRAAARRSDSLDLAVAEAIARSLGQLVADSSFALALEVPPPRRLEDLLFGPAWDRPLPGPGDTMVVALADRNPSQDQDGVQRVARGVLGVHGRGTPSVTAFAITRDGLALASRLPVGAARLWGRFHDGVDRPVRVLRSSGDLALLQVACEEVCQTVPWSDTAALGGQEPVFTLAGPRFAGDALYLAGGRLRPAAGVDREGAIELRSDGDLDGGEPVARRSDGLVVAIVWRGRALALGEALRRLRVAVRGRAGS